MYIQDFVIIYEDFFLIDSNELSQFENDKKFEGILNLFHLFVKKFLSNSNDFFYFPIYFISSHIKNWSLNKAIENSNDFITILIGNCILNESFVDLNLYVEPENIYYSGIQFSKDDIYMTWLSILSGEFFYEKNIDISFHLNHIKYFIKKNLKKYWKREDFYGKKVMCIFYKFNLYLNGDNCNKNVKLTPNDFYKIRNQFMNSDYPEIEKIEFSQCLQLCSTIKCNQDFLIKNLDILLDLWNSCDKIGFCRINITYCFIELALTENGGKKLLTKDFLDCIQDVLRNSETKEEKWASAHLLHRMYEIVAYNIYERNEKNLDSHFYLPGKKKNFSQFSLQVFSHSNFKFYIYLSFPASKNLKVLKSFEDNLQQAIDICLDYCIPSCDYQYELFYSTSYLLLQISYAEKNFEFYNNHLEINRKILKLFHDCHSKYFFNVEKKFITLLRTVTRICLTALISSEEFLTKFIDYRNLQYICNILGKIDYSKLFVEEYYDELNDITHSIIDLLVLYLYIIGICFKKKKRAKLEYIKLTLLSHLNEILVNIKPYQKNIKSSRILILCLYIFIKQDRKRCIEYLQKVFPIYGTYQQISYHKSNIFDQLFLLKYLKVWYKTFKTEGGYISIKFSLKKYLMNIQNDFYYHFITFDDNNLSNEKITILSLNCLYHLIFYTKFKNQIKINKKLVDILEKMVFKTENANYLLKNLLWELNEKVKINLPEKKICIIFNINDKKIVDKIYKFLIFHKFFQIRLISNKGKLMKKFKGNLYFFNNSIFFLVLSIIN